MNEFKVGIVTAVGLILFGVMAFVVGDVNLGEVRRLVVDFPDALGIKAGEKVYLSGMRIGEVVAMEYSIAERRVFLTLQVDRASSWPQGSVFAIDTLGLMGEKYVGIEPVMGVYLRVAAPLPAEGGRVGFREFEHNEEVLLVCGAAAGLSESPGPGDPDFGRREVFGAVKKKDDDGSMWVLLEESLDIPTGVTVELAVSKLHPMERTFFTARTLEMVTEVEIRVRGASQGWAAGTNVTLVSSTGEEIQARITRPPRKTWESRAWAGVRFSSVETTTLVVGVPAAGSQRWSTSFAQVTVDGIPSVVTGPVYLGTKLLGMGDLIKTGRDVLRKVHAGVETANRLISNLNGFIEKDRLRDRLNTMVDNFVEASENVRSVTGDAGTLVDSAAEAADGISQTAEEAREAIVLVRDSVQELTEKLDGVADTVTEAVEGVSGGIKGAVRDIRGFTTDLSGFVRENLPRLRIMVDDFGQAAGKVRALADEVHDEGRSGARVTRLLDSLEGFSRDLGDISARFKDLLNDKDLGTEVRKTMKSVSNIADTVDGFIGGIRDTRLRLRTSAFRSRRAARSTGDVELDILPGGSGRTSLTLGAMDIGGSDTVRATWGYRPGGGPFGARFGVLESRLGLGLDAYLGSGFRAGLEVFDPANLRLNADVSVGLGENYGLRLRLRDLTGEKAGRETQIGFETIF